MPFMFNKLRGKESQLSPENDNIPEEYPAFDPETAKKFQEEAKKQSEEKEINPEEYKETLTDYKKLRSELEKIGVDKNLLDNYGTRRCIVDVTSEFRDLAQSGRRYEVEKIDSNDNKLEFHVHAAFGSRECEEAIFCISREKDGGMSIYKKEAGREELGEDRAMHLVYELEQTKIVPTQGGGCNTFTDRLTSYQIDGSVPYEKGNKRGELYGSFGNLRTTKRGYNKDGVEIGVTIEEYEGSRIDTEKDRLLKIADENPSREEKLDLGKIYGGNEQTIFHSKKGDPKTRTRLSRNEENPDKIDVIYFETENYNDHVYKFQVFRDTQYDRDLVPSGGEIADKVAEAKKKENANS